MVSKRYLENLAKFIDSQLSDKPKYGAVLIELKYQDTKLVNFKVIEETNHKPFKCLEEKVKNLKKKENRDESTSNPDIER